MCVGGDLAQMWGSDDALRVSVSSSLSVGSRHRTPGAMLRGECPHPLSHPGDPKMSLSFQNALSASLTFKMLSSHRKHQLLRHLFHGNSSFCHMGTGRSAGIPLAP